MSEKIKFEISKEERKENEHSYIISIDEKILTTDLLNFLKENIKNVYIDYRTKEEKGKYIIYSDKFEITFAVLFAIIDEIIEQYKNAPVDWLYDSHGRQILRPKSRTEKKRRERKQRIQIPNIYSKKDYKKIKKRRKKKRRKSK